MATNGLVVMTPTSIAYSGTSASINGDGSVAFSAVTSLSLNGVFTGDYDNYMVSVQWDATAVFGLFYRLRISGSDATTNYTTQYIWLNDTGIQAGRSSPDVHLGGMYSYNYQRNGMTNYLFGPYLTQPTAMSTVGVSDYLSASFYEYFGTHSGTTSFDGFTLFVNTTGNVTGGLTVFGFNQ